MKKKETQKFYRLDRILEKNCQYNMIIGERSNGKTYAVEQYILENYVKTGKQGAIIRRYRLDFQGKRGGAMFAPLVDNGEITKLTDGEWTGVYYYASQWFLCRRSESDPTKIVHEENPFCYAFALTEMEHDKSSGYPNITTIMFDEFMSRMGYVTDEFVLFMNTLSTIIRYRDDVKIFMLGNTVTKDCPYFKEMGLTHIQKMEQGSIEVYTYGNSNLKVAVEFCGNNNRRLKKKPSDVYFAFDNPRLQMITGTGHVWELGIYPHKPCDFTPKDIKFIYFISYNDNLLQCEVVITGNNNFTYIHPKTTELRHKDRDLIFDTETSPMFNYNRKLGQGESPIMTRLLSYYKNEKVFFSDNETGEVLRNYLEWCKRSSIFN